MTKLGQILTLVGFCLFLATTFGRQRARQQQRPPSPAFLKFQKWGSLAAYGCILAGIILMYYQK